MRLRFSNAFKSGLALMAGCLASASLAQGTTTPPGGALDQLQGSFLENRGQFDSRVRFVANQPGLTYWVTRDGLMVELYKIRKKAGVPSLQAKQGDPSDFENYEKVGQAVSIKFEGANSNAIAQGADQQKPVVDFLTSDTPVRGVKTFSESYIKDLYPGISMRNYQSGTALRYDLIVAPNADPNQIQMNITGADSYKVDADGSLTIKTQVGDLKNSSPLVYQVVGAKQVQVPASFKIANGKVGFQIGKYDKRFPLVIDPLVYGTYMGSNSIPFFSSGAEVMAAGTADVKGNLYMTGSTTSITFPINAGPFNISLAGGQDAFIARISVDAYSLDYCAFIGSAGTDAGLGIALSPNGYLWVGGTTNSAAFPGRINAFTGPTADIFLTRFQVDPVTSAITPNFSRYISQAGDVTNAVTRWSDLDVLPDGSPVVAGTSTNANLIAKGFAPFIFGTSGGSRDGFLMVFEPGSSLVAARWVGGTASDTLGQIGVNASGKIAVTGTVSFSGNQDTSIAPVPGFPTTAGVFPGGRLLRQADAFVVSMNSDLTTNFSAILGAADNDSAVAAAIDAGGNIYVTGKPGALNFPRTPGAFDEDLPGDSFLTKISANGSTVVYSTGLGHNGNVTPTTVKVDVRGVAVVGGVVSWVPTGNPAPTQPGSIPTTPDAIDGVYAGGNENADGAGNPPDANTYPSSNDAFVQFVSAPGSALLYSDYIGGGGNEATAELVTDRFGAAWVIGNTTPVYQGSGVGPKAPVGVPPYVTNDAFKDFADSGSTDGWAIKLRVGLPILSSVVFTPNSIAGGLGASTNATVTLRAAAPVGGVTLNATLLNPSICSFSNAGSVTTTTVFIPQGATTATVPVFSLAVNTPQTCDMRVVLDNDFKIARVTVNPWLDDFSVSPATLVGGNQVTARVRLFQAAISDTSVTLTTSRPDLVTLPAPAEIIVPAGATTATVPLNTNGVDADSSGIISGSLLGVTKDANFTLTPARLSGLIFNPGRVQSGEVSNMTVQFDGKTGVARTVNLTQGAGAAGILINGNPLPTTVTIPAQTSSVTVPALAPFVPASTSTTVIATQGAQTVSGTLFVDDIDIASLSITPATDVISGTVLTGKVTLTRPAGLTGFTVNLSSSNPSAGTLSTTVVTVAPGQTTSPNFTFNCAVVPADQVTTISASKTGFTTRSVNVTVRAISINLTLSPNSVLGGAQTSTATATLSAPAPASGLNITFSSANNAVATPQLTTVTIAGGSTTASTTIDTFKVANDTPVAITAAASPLVSNTKTLTVRAPGVVGFVINPSTVFGSQPATGTVTVEDTAPVGGMTIALSAAPAGFITFPATLTIPEGENSASFPITTIAVNADTTVTMTATGSSTSLTASITLLAPDITSVTFSPNLVKGGLTSTGTVTLGQVAPAGGLTVNITSDIPSIANSTVATVTIPAGSRTANFTVTTNRVSRLIAVGFTATIGLRTGKGYLYVKS